MKFKVGDRVTVRPPYNRKKRPSPIILNGKIVAVNPSGAEVWYTVAIDADPFYQRKEAGFRERDLTFDILGALADL